MGERISRPYPAVGVLVAIVGKGEPASGNDGHFVLALAAGSYAVVLGRQWRHRRQSKASDGLCCDRFLPVVGTQSGTVQGTNFPQLSPPSIVFVKLFGYFPDDDSKFSDNTADDKRFAIRHEVHALSHISVLYQSFIGYF